MLSKDGFLIGFVLSISPMSLHDLRRTMIFQGIDGKQRDKMLVEGLADLCGSGLITWALEPDYGNAPAVKPPDFDKQTFLNYWRDFIEKSDLSVQVPDRRNPTLFIEGTPKLNEELDKMCYGEWRREIRW